jgi:hypothetical protein
MNIFHGFRSHSLLVSTAVLALGCGAQAAELPLTRVVLSTAGIAQFTHAGPVTAGSTVDLAVRFDQVDDILKSLTVFDTAGAIGPVSLPGQAPLAELFRDLPFGSTPSTRRGRCSTRSSAARSKSPARSTRKAACSASRRRKPSFPTMAAPSSGIA